LKKLRFLFASLCFLCIFCLSANSAFAFEFNFYYQEIEEVYDPASKAEKIGLVDKVKNWINGEKVEIVKSNYVPPSGSADAGHAQIAYKKRTTKVSSLNELYKAMGVTQADYNNGKLTNGQKTLIDTFKMAKSEAITNRTKHALQKSCDVYLVNSDDFDNNSKVSSYVKNAIRKDSWPCSMNGGKGIRMSSSFFCKQPNTDSAVSTFVHEYSHTLDKTVREADAYGQDKTHKINEITTQKAAFKEAWAEYNEMIEFDSTRDKYLAYSTANSTLCIESKKAGEAGKYSNIKASKCTAEQLLASEMFMNRMLYKLHELLGKDSKGNDIVSNAFYATNGKNTGMSDLIKRLIKDNPKYAKEIIKIVDEVTLKKMSKNKLTEFVGNSKALEEYLANRNVSSSTSSNSSSIKKNSVASKARHLIKMLTPTRIDSAVDNYQDSVIIENTSGNPFED
jgi:hypothetical protein